MNTKTKTSEAEKSSATHRAPRSRVEIKSEPRLRIHPALALARTQGLPALELHLPIFLSYNAQSETGGVQSVLHQRIESPAAPEPGARLAIQAKTWFGPAGDEYEREADGLAQQVVTANPTPAGNQVIQRQPDEEEEKRKKEEPSSGSTTGFEFESTSRHIGPPAPAQQQNQLAPFNLPHIEDAHNEGALEFATGPPAADYGIPDIDNLIALIKKLMLMKTQKKKS